MADRYWVGGSGNWNATSTTNWATSSGGSSGASAPTSADNVIFDGASNTGTNPFTVTVTGTSAAPALCADFSTSSLDGAMTLTMGATAFLDVYGSMTLPATNFSVSGTAGAGIRYKSTTTGKTLTTNGVSLGNVAITFDGVGGGWTLGSAYTSTQLITLTNGTFDTGNYNITSTGLLSSNSNTRTVTLGSATLTLSAASNPSPINFTTATNLTLNAGTSTIICSATSLTFAGGGQTFYNVSFTSTAGGDRLNIITGANTYNDLNFTSRTTTSIPFITIDANQTISGTLTLGAANTAIRRIFVRSNVVGTPRTITAATVATLSDVDFRDIVGAGLGTWSGTRLGNCGGNTGITFDAAKTVYRVGTGGWSATQWSLTSGGSVDVNNFPLAQDTAIFDTGTTTGTHTIDSGWNIGNLDMSALTVAVTLNNGAFLPTIYGNLTLDANVTVTGAGQFSFSGVSNQTITSVSKTFTQALIVNKPTTTSLILGDALTSNLGFTLTQGTLDLNNFNLTCLTFASSGTTTRAIAFGTNKIVVTGNAANVLSMNTVTNFTYTGTPTVEFNYSGSTGTRTCAFGSGASGTESNALNINVTAGTDIFALGTSGTSVYKNIDFTGFSGTFDKNPAAFGFSIFGNLLISSTTTVSATAGGVIFAATSGTQTITTNGKTLDFPVTKQGAGTLQLLDNLTIGSTRTFTLTAGTLDLTGNSGNWTLSTGLFNSSNSNTRVIAFGTGSINITGNNASVFDFSTATNFSYTGTSNITFSYSGSTGTRAIAPPGSTTGGTEANTMNVNVTAGSDTINVSTTRTFKNLDFTGFTGTFTLTGAAWVYGNLTLSTGMSVGASAFVLSFKATSGTQLITSNGKTINNAVTFDGIGGTFKLQDAMTVDTAYTTTLTNGALDLNNQTLSTGLFSSSNANTRAIAFGTGKIVVTGNNASVFTINNATNFTYTGSGRVDFTYSGSTGTRTALFAASSGGSESNALTFYITAGSDIFSISQDASKPHLKDLNYTGFSGSIGNTYPNLYGNLTFSTGMTLGLASNFNLTFASSANEQQVTFNGKTADWAFIVANTGTGFTKLMDNMTIGSTRTLTHTSNTLDLNDNTLTTGLYSSTGSTARQLDVGTGTLAVTGATFTASGSNYTTAGTGTISMTSASSKTFAGGGFTYPTLNQGGAGNLIITGANTFANITNTVQPATITFPASTTTTVSNFSLLGTAGNLITINSSTAGTQHNFVYTGVNIVICNYLSIQDSNASPSTLTWYAGVNSTNVSNNTGWIFTNVPILASITENFLVSDGSTQQLVYNISQKENSVLADSNTQQTAYNVPITEDSVLADSSTQQTAYNVPITEDSVLNETEAITAQFAQSMTEDSVLDETEAITAQFAQSMTENSVLADSNTQQTSYNVPRTENVILLDLSHQTGWISINNNQSNTWTLINDNQ
jgi:hypothetical protein